MTTATCPRCGASLPDDSPEPLCGTCRIRAVLETVTQAPAARIDVSAALPADLPSPADLERMIPSLAVVGLLGRGGMGAVYLANQISLDRKVALKILPQRPGQDEAFVERFSREARSLAKLNHPHIVAIYDFGRADGLFYFVMEFVDGANLREAMRAGRLDPSDAISIVSQVCDALQFAHDRGVIHRDIKPENILIGSDGRVKIADFGLAKLLSGDGADPGADRSLTGTHQVMGTYRYMAPEQLEGAKHVDHRADIYSLGVTLYEMLTGEVPLGRFAPPSKKSAADPRLDDIVLHALERDPIDRYQHAREFRAAIHGFGPAAPMDLSHPTRSSPPSNVKSVSSFDPAIRKAHWWLDLPVAARRSLKIILAIASFGLFVAFASIGVQKHLWGNASGHQWDDTFKVGYPDVWFESSSWRGHRAEREIHFLSWSIAAGILSGLLLWALALIHRLELQSIHYRDDEARRSRVVQVGIFVTSIVGIGLTFASWENLSYMEGVKDGLTGLFYWQGWVAMIGWIMMAISPLMLTRQPPFLRGAIISGLSSIILGLLTHAAWHPPYAKHPALYRDWAQLIQLNRGVAVDNVEVLPAAEFVEKMMREGKTSLHFDLQFLGLDIMLALSLLFVGAMEMRHAIAVPHSRSAPSVDVLSERTSQTPSRFSRYLYQAGLPTLGCWLLVIVLVNAVSTFRWSVENSKEIWLAALIYLGIVAPLFFHCFWFAFSFSGQQAPRTRASRAGQWMFGLGIGHLVIGVFSVILGSVMAVALADDVNSRDNALIMTSCGLLFGVGFGILLLRGGHCLAQQCYSPETRIAAIMLVLPISIFWLIGLPVGILVLQIIDRSEIFGLVDKKSVAEDAVG